MKNIFLLGATGSIGTQVLDLIKGNPSFRLKSISIGRNIKRGIEIIEEFSPEFISVMTTSDKVLLEGLFPNIIIEAGESSLARVSTYTASPGSLVNAVVGMRGLVPTIEAIKMGRDILLANKETLVVAGDIINSLVDEYNVRLIPIDSEHSAIHQCLNLGKKKDVLKLIITASGGALRDKSRTELGEVKVSEVLNHPNWEMGAKITVDSATMVNKGLEVIEAHHLFKIAYDRIETVLHYESIVHSMVEFNDYSIIAHLGVPDMKVPISYALNYPNKLGSDKFERLDFRNLNLNFKEMDYRRFPLLATAYKVGMEGGVMPTVYNAANEVAVGLFLDGNIKFLEIEKIINESLLEVDNITSPCIEDILKVDLETRKKIIKNYEVT